MVLNEDYQNTNNNQTEALMKNKTVIVDDRLIKELSEDIFLKNKEKRESSIHHADFLVPRYDPMFNSDLKDKASLDQRLSLAGSKIRLINSLARESLPVEETTKAHFQDTTQNANTTYKTL